MPDLATMRERLAGLLTSIDGLQQSPYLLSAPTPPCAEIVPAPVDYDLAFHRGTDLWTFTVRVMVSTSVDIGAQKRLDRMLAPNGLDSVKERLESDPKLGGLVDNVNVTSCTGYRLFRREGAATLLGAEWTVQVHAPGG